MRRVFKLLAGIVGMLAAIWLGAWWYVEYRLEAFLLDSIHETEASGAVKFTYTSVTRGTSPLAAMTTLHNVQISLQPHADAQPILVTLPSFGMHVNIAAPLLIWIDMPSQIDINTPRAPITVTFGNITGFSRLAPRALVDHSIQPFAGNEVEANNINILSSNGSLQVLHIDDVSSKTTIDNPVDTTQATVKKSLEIDGLALSPILTRIAAVPFDGRVKHLNLDLAVSGELSVWQMLQTKLTAFPPDSTSRRKIMFQAIHDWAAAGGTSSANLSLSIGPSTLSATGNIKFDNNIQPSGTADVTADHLDSFSAALTGAYPQIQNIINNIEARLSPYLSTTSNGGQILTMHVGYRAGSLLINGIKAADLPPIDWNTLENPPALPRQAPGDGSGAASGQ